MRIPLELIKHQSKEGKIRRLAVFILLKQQFQSGVFKDNSISYISKTCKVSRNQIRKYIAEFKELGWYRVWGSYGSLIGFKKLCDKMGLESFNTIEFKGVSNIREIIKELRYRLLKSFSDQFKFLKDSWQNKRKVKSYKHLKKLGDVLKGKKEISANCNYQCSLIKIGQRLKLSRSGAQRVMKGLAKDGKIEKRARYKQGIKVSALFIKFGDVVNQPTYYSKKNYAIKICSNEYIF